MHEDANRSRIRFSLRIFFSKYLRSRLDCTREHMLDRYSRERGGSQAVYVLQKDRVRQISLAEPLDPVRFP